VCLVIADLLNSFLMGLYDSLAFLLILIRLSLLPLSFLYLVGTSIYLISRFHVTSQKLGTRGIAVFIFMCVMAILFFKANISIHLTNLGMKLNVKMNGGYDHLYSWAQEIIEKHKREVIERHNNEKYKYEGSYILKEELPPEIKDIVSHATVFIKKKNEQPDRLYLEIDYSFSRPAYWEIVIGNTMPKDSPENYDYYFWWNSHIYSHFHCDD